MNSKKRPVIHDKEVLQTYCAQVGRFPLIDFEEELELSRRIKAGNKLARQKLINANLRLVIKIARSYLPSDVAFMDLIQEGNLGLIRAADKYDYAKHVRFSTYANWWIRQSISRFLSDKRRTIRLPHRKEEIVRKAKKAVQTLSQSLMRQPKIEEIAKEIGESVENIEHLLNMTYDIISLESDIEEDDFACAVNIHADYTYNPELEFIKKTYREDVLRFLSYLKERDRKVIMCRYKINGCDSSTLKSIGVKMGLSPEAVRQIEIRAIKTLRSRAERHREEFYRAI
jgi:RNA polymerase primary sigma factor